jgi:hypothetical protein
MIGLLDGDIASVDMVAKFLQSLGVIQNEIVDLVRFVQTPIRDLNRQLHDYFDTNVFRCPRGTKMFSTMSSHLL